MTLPAGTLVWNGKHSNSPPHRRALAIVVKPIPVYSGSIRYKVKLIWGQPEFGKIDDNSYADWDLDKDYIFKPDEDMKWLNEIKNPFIIAKVKKLGYV